ncbi:PepSY-associated TM helix domain-containing protein [Haliangium ochraceum]|uniref:PepSY-associated TM helix domain protein n=1 Tax=Haliangium ochraceum (strain DSM 14365 / JCM 11303 / SMP-2) TaxID=502025 RepID=D0LH71_HALO1|nr:PepSY-associated TM helix domain-containing protein [Haliangium ochraceum]ACY18216.1 conserved hypothetical protein [Haliangium ochraceum DSM 14365]
MRWRQWTRALHRDIGYATTALVIAYSLSGLAVNHIDDWNPSYRMRDLPVAIGPVPPGSGAEQQAHVVAALNIAPGEVRGHFRESENRFRVFLDEGQEVRVDLDTGAGVMKRIDPRPVLFEVNALHLNNLKGIWTWIADLFAIALLLLAITGLLMNKGRRGLLGRGKWFVGAGLLVPIAFVFYLHAG